MKSVIKVYIKEAYKYYEKHHPQLCPDAEDITGCVCDFIEDDSGCEVDEKMYNKIFKIVAGK